MWLVFFGVGGIVSSWLCFGMVGWDNSWAWRLPTLVQILGTLSVAIYIGCGFMAESPRWLVSKGRVDEALRSLAKMHANGDVNDELVQHELNEIKRGVEIDGQSIAGYSALIQTPGNRRRLLVLMVIAATGQINGAALVSYYLVPILKQVGITSSSQQAGVNGGLSIWGTICIIIAAQFVERLGRRPLWLTGAVGVLASFILLAAFSVSEMPKS
jgi:MFS family permease